ncbi:MAG TPA: hypothetical protein VIF57_29420 [Polyangia bacterium]|jgi:hypothetical protein
MSRCSLHVTLAGFVGLAGLTLGGALGCNDGHLPPSDPGPSGTGPEGIPVALALPVVSGACTLTDQAGQVTTATWEATTFTFTLGTLYWRLDQQARTAEYGQTDGQWRESMTRDSHGVLTGFTYEWQGAEYAPDSFDQTNTYDSAGRLIGTKVIYRDGSRSVETMYQYEAERLTSSATHAESTIAAASDTSTRYLWNDARLYGREFSAASQAYSLETRSFDDAGRLVRIDIDGAGLGPAIDGTPDLRRDWSYDGAGRVSQFVSDGTAAFDAPVVDGVPDGTTTFDPACAGIAVRPDVLYGFQSWLQQN